MLRLHAGDLFPRLQCCLERRQAAAAVSAPRLVELHERKRRRSRRHLNVYGTDRAKLCKEEARAESEVGSEGSRAH